MIPRDSNFPIRETEENRVILDRFQVHLNIGLNKISETEEQVKELQKSLTLKSKVGGIF